MRIIKRVTNYLEKPTFVNLEDFCKNYLELSESYFSLGDEDQINAIKKAKDEVLVAKALGTEIQFFVNKSAEEIIAYFEREMIRIVKKIPKDISEEVKNEIKRYLIRNLIYAQKLKMNIPKAQQLTVEEFYENYKIVKDSLPVISYRAGKGFK